MVKKDPKPKKIPEWKKKQVEEIRKLAESYPTIAFVDMRNLPTKQLQIIRHKLKGKILIKIAKKRIIKRAFEGAKEERIRKFVDYITEVPGLIFSKLGAFELFKILKENRSSAPIKPGQIAPEDIWVPAGPTPFTPGPVISDFGKLGIKTAVEGGKIAIKSDTLVVKKGEKVSLTAASILARLGIEPLKIGVTPTVVLEGNDVYSADVLDIDIDQYIQDIQKAHSDAFKLALECAIINSETVEFMLIRAFNDAKVLAISQDILTSETISQILAKAESQANALEKTIQKRG